MKDSRIASAAPSGRDVGQRSRPCVAHDRDERMDDQVQRQAVAVHFHRHRIDQERHVVVDDLDDRVRRLPAVLLDRRVEHAHAGVAGLTFAREVPVRKRRAVQVGGARARRGPRDRPVRSSGRRSARARRAARPPSGCVPVASTASSSRARPSSAWVFIVSLQARSRCRSYRVQYAALTRYRCGCRARDGHRCALATASSVTVVRRLRRRDPVEQPLAQSRAHRRRSRGSAPRSCELPRVGVEIEELRPEALPVHVLPFVGRAP